jgi:serine protease AprX
MCEAVERAVRAGIVVVTAAGNFGRSRTGFRVQREAQTWKTVFGGITSPGNDPHVLTVGAIDTQGTPERSDDTVAAYSSRGPTMYDLVMKPDVMAPGSRIVSAEVAGSVVAREHPERHVTGAGANAYIQFSGTSMAAAVVSGVAALLLQNDPNLTPADVKAVLQLTSSFMRSSGAIASGAGSLNALAATGFVASGYAELPATSIADEQIAASGFSALDAGFDLGLDPGFDAGLELGFDLAAASGAGAPSIVWARSVSE